MSIILTGIQPIKPRVMTKPQLRLKEQESVPWPPLPVVRLSEWTKAIETETFFDSWRQERRKKDSSWVIKSPNKRAIAERNNLSFFFLHLIALHLFQSNSVLPGMLWHNAVLHQSGAKVRCATLYDNNNSGR
ncbi:uncharacterized protein ACBT44_011729 [Syngnathus typhle]